MLIDCDTCTAGPSACGDCIVTHLLSTAPVGLTDPGPADPDLTEAEIAAVGVLAAGGLVPPLRLVQGAAPDRGHEHAPPARARPAGHPRAVPLGMPTHRRGPRRTG